MKPTVLFALTFVLVGAGCASLTQQPVVAPQAEPDPVPEIIETSKGNTRAKVELALDLRVQEYEIEREGCIEARISTTSEEANRIESETYLRNAAEYRCSTVELAKKYYAEDREGVTELCVRTHNISGYTKEDGYFASIGREELDMMQSGGLMVGVGITKDGIVRVDDETHEQWSELCRTVIDGVIARASGLDEPEDEPEESAEEE